jgi:hypothetical protein
MHSMPYLIKNPAGTWCVQRKVPAKLQAAVARILGGKRSTQVYLKKSLATKNRREATRRAPHEPVSTPPLPTAPSTVASGTLREAFEGWKKERDRPEGTLHEHGRAIDLFIQLHGNLPILEMKRSHARTFREALQLVPRSRKGQLLKAALPELSEYGRTHPTVQKVSAGTVNKQIGAVQAVAGRGRHNGLVPEDAPWSNPFEEMRLEEEQSEREPFDARDLQTIFDAPLFTERKIPVGAKGDAGIWLPLLALFAGAQQAEYAGLRVSDIREEEDRCHCCDLLLIVRQAIRQPCRMREVHFGHLGDGSEVARFPTCQAGR